MIEIGPFVLLRPEEGMAPRSGRLPILIHPGWAFGDGSHSSTRNMLLALPGVVGPGLLVLDFGTGTGILAIAAARLGASVTACEADLAAYREAQANIQTNGLASRVSLKRTAGEVPDGPYDVTLANLGRLERLPFLLRSAQVVLATDESDHVHYAAGRY